MRWAILQHVAFEGPGLLLEEIERRGHTASICRLDRHEPLPAAQDIDGLIVMGGPMGVYEQDRYPHIAPEIALIQEGIAAAKPVLGVCLGSQLLAAALGARVYPGPQQEIGFGSVEFTAAAASDPAFATAPATLSVFHWHGDTFDLPAGATLLASSTLYPHQAFRHGSHVYGLQFHVEPNHAIWTAWQPHLPAERYPDPAQQRQLESTGKSLIQNIFDVIL